MFSNLVGGIGSAIDNTVTGATDTAGDAAGNLFGGAFSPIFGFMLKLAVIAAVGLVAIRVIG